MERVEVATFDWINEAELVRIFLEDNDIEVEIVDSQIAAAYPLLANAVGGIKLKVKKEDAERATDLLINYEKEMKEKHKLWCPNCESEDVEKIELHGLLKFLSILTMGIVSMVASKSFLCKKCGHKWR